MTRTVLDELLAVAQAGINAVQFDLADNVDEPRDAEEWSWAADTADLALDDLLAELRHLVWLHQLEAGRQVAS